MKLHLCGGTREPRPFDREGGIIAALAHARVAAAAAAAAASALSKILNLLPRVDRQAGGGTRADDVDAAGPSLMFLF